MIKTACARLAPFAPECICVVSAIAKNDSSCGTAGVGARFNNVTNLRCLHPKDAPYRGTCSKGTYGYYEKFDSMELGIYAAVDLWNRKYRGFPPDMLVTKWATTTPERNPEYFESIRSCY